MDFPWLTPAFCDPSSFLLVCKNSPSERSSKCLRYGTLRYTMYTVERSNINNGTSARKNGPWVLPKSNWYVIGTPLFFDVPAIFPKYPSIILYGVHRKLYRIVRLWSNFGGNVMVPTKYWTLCSTTYKCTQVVRRQFASR